MEFKLVKQTSDPLYEAALKIYDNYQFGNVNQKHHIFKQSLENKRTQNDYVFLVGLDQGEPVSLATAHYEATTNAAFIIYLVAVDAPDRARYLAETLEKVQDALDNLANHVHDRDVNFFMMEALPVPDSSEEKDADLLVSRHRFLNEHGFEQQREIDYVRPALEKGQPPIALNLFLHTRIPLTKDIYATSVKSCYILKYVFANHLSRKTVYPLLEQMDLRKS
ncbi:hypothetical protein [Staphylococcus simulans]|uniref:hypothetical protein n=1 Tax=Staphylococcus simulans TaxID=1286 RepID=UPI003F7E154A